MLKTPLLCPPAETSRANFTNARCVYIRVADNGRGMDAETLERLRALARSTDPQDGGIGLRYVFRALKMMYASGVRIEIDSAPDVGTAITITIER